MKALISALPFVGLAGLRRDDVRPGVAGVGDEPLAAVDDPGAAVGAVLVAGGGSRAAGIAAGAGLGQAVAAEDLAGRHRDEEALLLLRCARQVEGSAAETRVGRDDQAERAPDPADLLDGDRVGQRVQAGPALVFGDRDAEPAHLAEALDDVDREASGPLVLVDDRLDLLDHEVADRLAEEGVFRREIEVHLPESTAPPAAPPRPILRLTGLSASLAAMPEQQPQAYPSSRSVTSARVAGPAGRIGPAPGDPRPAAPGRPELARADRDAHSAPAGPASSSNCDRSRPRASSTGGPSDTASAARATCTTSPPTPRSPFPRTTTRWRRGCWRRSGRSAGTSSSPGCSPSGAS